MVKALATILTNEEKYFLKEKTPIAIHEGNTVLVKDAIPGVEIIYEAIKKEISYPLSYYHVLKDNKNTDTLREIRSIYRESKRLNLCRIYSIAFPNHMLAIERIWNIYKLYQKIGKKEIPLNSMLTL